MNIILIGFMGAGKTVVGRKLAADLGYNYLDTDALVEKTARQPISEIFAQRGAAYFRDLETEVAKTLPDYDGFVIATGGGMVLREDNVRWLKQSGPLILLWAEPEVIFQRIKHETQRPLLRVPEPRVEIERILRERRPIYEQAADYKINTGKLSVKKVSEEIKAWLKSKSN
ncbi:shikimate kinase [Candidatus Saganbacteria bacterium]|nr:shikimate kinase [Candidatus Saganbacteria bacterium]